ncbi:MAG: hypothetical protein AAFR24_00480 [Cyanobacteria bacterium J06627_3]
MKRVKSSQPLSRLHSALVVALCSCFIYCAILLWLAPWPTAARDIWINGLAGFAVSVVEVFVHLVYFLPKFYWSQGLPIIFLILILLFIVLVPVAAALSFLNQRFPKPSHTWEEIWAVEGAPQAFWWVLLIITLNTIFVTGITVAYDWPREYFTRDFIPVHALPTMVWVAQMAIFLAYVSLDRKRPILSPVTWPTNWILAVVIAFSLSGLALYNRIIPRHTFATLMPFLESYVVTADVRPAFAIVNRHYGAYDVRAYYTFKDGSMHFIVSQPFPRFNRNETVGLAYQPDRFGNHLVSYYPLTADWAYFELKSGRY